MAHSEVTRFTAKRVLLRTWVIRMCAAEHRTSGCRSNPLPPLTNAGTDAALDCALRIRGPYPWLPTALQKLTTFVPFGALAQIWDATPEMTRHQVWPMAGSDPILALIKSPVKGLVGLTMEKSEMGAEGQLNHSCLTRFPSATKPLDCALQRRPELSRLRPQILQSGYLDL